MTRDETKKVIEAIASVYPNWHPDNPSLTVDMWAAIMSDYPYSAVSDALREYARSKNGFAPSPGQLIGLIIDRTTPQAPTDMEAWQLVYEAIRNSNYHADEEYAKLPVVIQKAIGGPASLREMAMMEADAMSVEQSHFLRSYHTVLERQRQDMSITPYERLGQVEEPPRIEQADPVEVPHKRASAEFITQIVSRLKEVHDE